MRYVFYVNPAAGKGEIQESIISSIKSYFADKSEEFKIHITKAVGDARADARREAETGDDIRMFACGGEGTVFEVLNGIAGYSNVELGVIPCGSANDFLKFFESSDNFLNIGEQIDGEAVEMDLIKAGDNYCLNGCSVGMDAVVARDMSIFKKWPAVSGSLAYN
ncbi:MAG: acylglycerol kinase family protein, partial [Clostridia bacterium]|nr:acylglycerol kinase family protein [Clostridia bacterium]